ncbi:MAG: ROK family protein [Rikenellaceae bacterium]|jgi:glucokinase|nr:ROK family protein [Rikenellaceae bacterium]
MDKKYVIGVDIGGQTSKLGVVDARGNVVAQSVIRTDTHDDVNLFIKDLGKAIRALAGQVDGGMGSIRGVGMGAPNGNYYRGTIEFAPNLKWKGVIPLADLASAEIGLPVRLTNDANAAAVGEMTYGAARGMKNFIMITLGTGVGSGIVVGGYVLYGHDGFAGELGHTIQVRSNGRLCGCGRTGCLEAYASAVGVARTAREILETTDRPTLLREMPRESITSKDVAEAAAKGDQVAIEIFDFTGRMLGAAMADFVAFSAPEAIILFGGLTRSGDLIKKPVVDSLNDNLLDLWKGKIKVEFSELKESDAAILGASALAWEL